MSKQSTLGTEVLDLFAAQLQGTLIRPSDPDYDTARRVWNGIIDRYPAVIARCAHIDDVVSSVNFAREHQLAVAVRGGGHSVAGHGTVDNGLVIDLSLLNRVDVYPETRIAAVQGGATWSEVDAATQAHSLATPGGVVSDTGIAGLTLGGGFGWLRNKHGLSCDNLGAAEVVTADGRIVYATENENRELLWGLRGGGGNFGIVTTFEFRLHPVGPEVMFVFVMHNAEDERMRQAIRFYRDYAASSPDEVSSVAAIGIVPSAEHFVAEVHGKRFILFGALYVGDPEQGKTILQPLLDFGVPLHDISGVMPYVQAQKVFDEDYPKGMRYYWKSVNLSRLDDDVIDRIVEHAHKQISPYSTIDIWHIGGAMARTSSHHSAFFGRQAAFLLNPEANWQQPEDDAINIAWVHDFVAAMQPFSDGSRYLNFAGFHEEGSISIQASFGEQYERLVALKNCYDPTNFFRMNQNIEPAMKGKAESS
jgi:FAD/FMN-containing dehydrogenase